MTLYLYERKICTTTRSQISISEQKRCSRFKGGILVPWGSRWNAKKLVYWCRNWNSYTIHIPQLSVTYFTAISYHSL